MPNIIFEGTEIRRIMGKDGKMYFSIVDTVARLLNKDRRDATFYWRDHKKRLEKKDFQLWEKISQLKMIALDGKQRLTDACDLETMFRIIESIPSSKAEPIKKWLAQAGKKGGKNE